MLLYITLGTSDLKRARGFYDAALGALSYVCRRAEEFEIGYAALGDSRSRLWITTPFNKRAASVGNGSMVAFDAPDRASVDAFYAAALDSGGTDEGKPGLRPYHADFYACYVRDPDGNKLSAVCERAE
ncbi:lactoylglutathione lyase [Mesorhizobium sp. LSHC422A00]|uniref:VOC family protein n=1 Tax=Mesorhizobium sp. LSHC422A00 TaxID=1287294 RepID=UPI0003CE1887|nr:VOC family protein [Mesorhizobium sp. LSHC422A00]ESX51826.1 lactoylglutathione lyase [Mesorhizobium sp. LSHC422A00]